MTKKKSDNNSVLLKSATEKEVAKVINNSKEFLRDLEKPVNNIKKIISKAEAQEKFFVLDGLIGLLFETFNLPPYIISSICGKYNLISQLPYTVPNVPKEQTGGSYIG